MNAQHRAEIESRTARYSFLGIEHQEHTDPQGRVSAIGRFRYEPMETTPDGKLTPTGERYDVKVQVYKDPLLEWQPLEGYAGILAAALALPARTGRKVRRASTAAARTRWGDRDRAAEVQAYFDAMGRAPHLDAEKTRAVKAAARATGLSEGHIWRLLQQDRVHFRRGRNR